MSNSPEELLQRIKHTIQLNQKNASDLKEFLSPHVSKIKSYLLDSKIQDVPNKYQNSNKQEIKKLQNDFQHNIIKPLTKPNSSISVCIKLNNELNYYEILKIDNSSCKMILKSHLQNIDNLINSNTLIEGHEISRKVKSIQKVKMIMMSHLDQFQNKLDTIHSKIESFKKKDNSSCSFVITHIQYNELIDMFINVYENIETLNLLQKRCVQNPIPLYSKTHKTIQNMNNSLKDENMIQQKIKKSASSLRDYIGSNIDNIVIM